jgi:serine/threonine protein kinase
MQDTRTPGVPIGIRFEKNGFDPIELYCASAPTLQLWKDHLEKMMNQRGFHSLFKPIKKIGKGNFASVYLAERLEDHKMVAVKAFSKESVYAQEKGR